MVGAYRPLSLAEALSLRSGHDTIVMAGGTDLMVKYGSWPGTLPSLPKDVLLIGHLPELREINVSEGFARIGSAVTFSSILEDARLPDYVKRPISEIGSPAIRNMGTIGGNICNSSPAGDSLPMLYALGAILTIASVRGARICGIADFLDGPGHNNLAKDEILQDIRLPLGNYDRFFYHKAGQRRANAIAKLSFYGVAETEGTLIKSIRIALGAVAPVIVRVPEAEAILESATRDSFEDAAGRAISKFAENIVPIDDLRSTKVYRKEVALSLLVHFIRKELGL